MSSPLYNSDKRGGDIESNGSKSSRLQEEEANNQTEILPSTITQDQEQVQESYGGNYRRMRDRHRASDGLMMDDEDQVYITKQRYGYCSILIGIIQIVILVLMLLKAGVAPLYVNPMIGPYPETLSDWGGKNTELILRDEEYWRLVTPLFLHAGVIHLLGNVSVQLELGVLFEREWGSIIWCIIYFLSGIGGSIASVYYMPNEVVSVGSSGAIMGLFGGKLSEVVMKYFRKRRTVQERIGHQIRKEQCSAVTCSVIVVLAFSFIPFVDWAAHVGGLLTGMAVGIVLFLFDR